jgi:hypothetical protein
MSVVGPFLVVTLVLVVSGVAKVVAPASSAAMLSAVAGRTVPGWVGRTVGVVEIALGGVALAGWRPSVVAVGAAYLVFALVAELARRREVPSCGCFGGAEAPPSRLHVVLDVASAAVAFGAAAVSAHRSLPAALDHGPAVALGTTAALVAAVAMIITAETVGAEVVSARRALAEVRIDDRTPNRHRR